MANDKVYLYGGWSLFGGNLLLIVLYSIWIIKLKISGNLPNSKFIIISFINSSVVIALSILFIIMGYHSTYLNNHKIFENTFVLLQFTVFITIFIIGNSINTDLCGSFKGWAISILVS